MNYEDKINKIEQEAIEEIRKIKEETINKIKGVKQDKQNYKRFKPIST